MNGVEEQEGKRDWECRIGFERKGRPGVLDIEVRILLLPFNYGAPPTAG